MLFNQENGYQDFDVFVFILLATYIICKYGQLLIVKVIILSNIFFKMNNNQTQQIINDEQHSDNQSIDIIKQTKKLINNMDEKKKFEIAKNHLFNAINFKAPRLDTFSDNISSVFYFCYLIQTSKIWQNFLLLIAYLFMYQVIWITLPTTWNIIGLEIGFLLPMWIDIIMEIYHKSFQVIQFNSKFQSKFYFKLCVHLLMIIDQILVISNQNLVVRPFLVLRCGTKTTNIVLPLFYDPHIRKAMLATISCYKDFLVYILFQAIIVVAFGVIANQIIQLPPDANIDPYSSNYPQLDKSIFLMYVLATYDNFPDNQQVAIDASPWISLFFALFIFLNIFFFVAIPNNILFNAWRYTRSKIILIDQIKQQHSLIMCFVCLSDQNFNITQTKLIKFLLDVYKNKIRYVNYIYQICRKLDDNNNGVVHVNQFMQLCKMLQADRSMLPPTFNDLQIWLNFRRYINNKFKLKSVISSKQFKLTVIIIIIWTFTNSLLNLYTNIAVFNVLQNILIGAFVLEIILKIIGLGPQKFFRDPWNKLDLVLIIVSLILELAPSQIIPHNSDKLFKMTRIFRVTSLIKFFFQNKKVTSDFIIKVTRLMSQVAIITPIVMRIFPIYMITFYLFGILGMQIFRQSAMVNHEDSPYATYFQYSNFNTFLASQFLLIQLLIESAWSTMTFDHVFKFGNYGLVVLFFLCCHISTVTILASLFKGIAWQVYSTVQGELNERRNKQFLQQIKQFSLTKRKQMVEQVKTKTDQKTLLFPDNIITRQLYQNKIDQQIFKKLQDIHKNHQQKLQISHNNNHKRSYIVSHLIKDRKILASEIDNLNNISQSIQSAPSSSLIITRLLKNINIDEIEDLKEEDIEEQMQKILSKIILHHKIQYSQAIVYPKILVQFLEHKLQRLQQAVLPRKGFNVQKDVIGNKDSVQFLTYCLNVLMEVQVSEREQKTNLFKGMIEEGLISEQDSIKLLAKKHERDEGFDSTWIMRKACLSMTNDQLVRKFQIQYFSSVYGKSFKQINKVTIQPLLSLQSRLTYCLRNLLRQRKIGQRQFFTLLSTIEDTISNKLLKKGSLFKFIYQIDSMSDIWFSIQLKQSSNLRIHFIKNGIWIYTKSMLQDQIYYTKDLFNWQQIKNRKDQIYCQKYIKMLFQSFQTLGLCLINYSNFFIQNPIKSIYNCYCCYHNIKNINKNQYQQFYISKIMFVILSKQQQRYQSLKYSLSDLKQTNKSYKHIQKQYLFKMNQSYQQTFQKLKKMQLMDHQKILQYQGLPFAFIINFMIQLQDILHIYQDNFLSHVQHLLNSKFQNYN